MTDLASLLAVVSAALVFGLGVEGLAWWGARRSHPPPQPQRTPFLGGSAPEKHAWSRFHVRFYPMTLLFIAFEMEMMFMYPWAVVYVQEGMKALAEMGMFLSLLAVGIVYAWREGVFRWQ